MWAFNCKKEKTIIISSFRENVFAIATWEYFEALSPEKNILLVMENKLSILKRITKL